MGVSTDGLLIYGYPLDEYEEVPDWLEEHSDIEATLIKMGFDRDSYDYTWENRIPSNKTEYERYKADRAILKKQAQEQFGIGDGVGIEVTCSYDYPIWYVSAKSHSNSRGHGKKLSFPDDLYITTTQLRKFDNWVEFMNLPKKDLNWWLESLWG